MLVKFDLNSSKTWKNKEIFMDCCVMFGSRCTATTITDDTSVLFAELSM